MNKASHGLALRTGAAAMVVRSLADKRAVDKEGQQFKELDKAEAVTDRKRQRTEANVEKRRTDKERETAELIREHTVPQARAKYDAKEESKLNGV